MKKPVPPPTGTVRRLPGGISPVVFALGTARSTFGPLVAGNGFFGRLARWLAWLALALFLGSNDELHAQDAASFTYDNDGNSITITGYSGAGGAVTVPAIIDGLPVTGIGDGAFYDRTGLTRIDLPNSVTYIGSWAFYGCTSLTNVTLPDSLTFIGYEAFRGCAGLTQITFPDSLTSIGYAAFQGCTGLNTFEVALLNPAYSSRDGVLFDKSQTFLLQYPAKKAGDYILPTTVTVIKRDAFRNCTDLTSITIPASVSDFYVETFSGCTGLKAFEVDPLNPIYSSRDGVLFNKDQTALLQYPKGRSGPYIVSDGVSTIGDAAFSGCSSLVAINVSGANTNYGSVDGVLFNKHQTVLLQYPGGRPGPYTVPDGVIAFADAAFSGCTGLTRITLPQSVTYVGYATFSGCSNLVDIDVSNANPEYSSIDGVVFDKDQTTLLVYPPRGRQGAYSLPNKVTSIAGSAFYACAGLTQINLPNGLTNIGCSAFSGCSNLVRVTVPDGVTYIGGFAFSGCSRLTEVSLGQAIKQLNYGLFSECRSLKSLNIPDSVREVAAMVTGHETPVFSNCLELRQLHLGRGLTGVRWGWNGQFWTCPNLTSLSVAEDHPVYRSIDGVLFSRDGTELVCVPPGRTGLYIVPAGVKSFGRWAIVFSEKLASIGFTGDAPSLGSDDVQFYVESGSPKVLYLPGTTGWKATFGGVPTAQWLPVLGRPAFAADQPAGTLGFPIVWAPQRQVTVEACTNLAQPDWRPVGTLTLAAAGTAQFTDPDSAVAPSRFYRLRTP